MTRWRRRRVMYYCALGALFAVGGLYVGPNYLLFDKPTWITPADFVPTVERRCVPIVRAMKEFRRDHGRLPKDGEELIPDYHPPEDRNVQSVRATVWEGKFRYLAMYNHSITYDFDPATEGWIVSGVYTSGRIPAPPVAIDPTPRATTRPTSSPATRPE